MKILSVQAKNCSKLKLNFSRSLLFHTNSKVCLIYFGQDCGITKKPHKSRSRLHLTAVKKRLFISVNSKLAVTMQVVPVGCGAISDNPDLFLCAADALQKKELTKHQQNALTKLSISKDSYSTRN